MKPREADIVITNGGGLRASIDQGPIAMSEVLAVLPFQDLLSRFELTGADVVATLESGVSQVEEGAGRFPQVAGLRYRYTLSRQPNEGRVSDVEVMQNREWVPINLEARYRIVSNDFLHSGADGYGVFVKKAMNAYDFGPNLAKVVAEYLANHSPYTPSLDGRIIVE